jgi:hypothetical protein
MKGIMQNNKQVTGFLGGERDYTNLKGDTGPLVYPAGFLYIYSAIRFITGGEVYPAQVINLSPILDHCRAWNKYFSSLLLIIAI